MKFSRFFYAAITFISMNALAARPETDFGRLNKIVDDAYFAQMHKLFVFYINSAKRNKLAADFLSDIAFLPEDSPARAELKNLFKDAPTPQVISISKGIELRSGQQTFRIMMSKQLGQVLLDGEPLVAPEGKRPLDILKEEMTKEARHNGSFMELVLPRADAGVIKFVGNLAWKALKLGTVGTVSGAAGGVVVGAGLGCFGQGYLGRRINEDAYEACKEGAQSGAAYGALIGGGWLGLTGGSIGFSDAWGEGKVYSYKHQDVVDGEEIKKFKAGFGMTLKTLGFLGTIYGLAELGNGVLELNGAEVQCNGNAGYSMVGVYNGVKKPIYYSPTGQSIVAKKDDRFRSETERKSMEDLGNFIKEKYKMDDEKASIVAKASWKEHQGISKWCAANPGKIYQTVMTNAKSLGDVPKPAEAKK